MVFSSEKDVKSERLKFLIYFHKYKKLCFSPFLLTNSVIDFVREKKNEDKSNRVTQLRYFGNIAGYNGVGRALLSALNVFLCLKVVILILGMKFNFTKYGDLGRSSYVEHTPTGCS